MKKPFDPFILSSLYLILLLLELLSLTFLALRRLPDTVQHRGEKYLPVYSDIPLTQTFHPRHDNINVVLISLKNPNLANIDPLIFTLSDLQGSEIRRVEASGRNTGDGVTLRFQFSPVPDSAGREFLIKLSAPNTSRGSPAISAGFSETDAYPLGRSLIPGESGDMSFQLFYYPSDKKVLFTELGILFFSRLVNPAYLKSFSLYLIVLFLVFRFLLSGIPSSPADRKSPR